MSICSIFLGMFLLEISEIKRNHLNICLLKKVKFNFNKHTSDLISANLIIEAKEKASLAVQTARWKINKEVQDAVELSSVS